MSFQLGFWMVLKYLGHSSPPQGCIMIQSAQLIIFKLKVVTSLAVKLKHNFWIKAKVKHYPAEHPRVEEVKLAVPALLNDKLLLKEVSLLVTSLFLLSLLSTPPTFSFVSPCPSQMHIQLCHPPIYNHSLLFHISYTLYSMQYFVCLHCTTSISI